MNYSELIEAIQGYLESDEDGFVARLDDFVIQAEQTIYRRVKLPASRAIDDGNQVCVPGTGVVSTPDNWLEILSVSLKDAGAGSNETVGLYRVDESYIREAYPGPAVQAQPYHYAVLTENQILLGPTPDAAYPLLIYYTRFPESIVTAGDTWLGKNAEQALLFGAIVNGYRYLKGEPDLFNEYKQAFEQELAILAGEGSDLPLSQKQGTEP